MTETDTWIRPELPEGAESALILRVDQIVDGEATCQCGAAAVLFVVTEPDGEPGPACSEHAWQWIDLAIGVASRLFPRKMAA